MSEKVNNFYGNVVYNDVHDNPNSLIIVPPAGEERVVKTKAGEERVVKTKAEDTLRSSANEPQAEKTTPMVEKIRYVDVEDVTAEEAEKQFFKYLIREGHSVVDLEKAEREIRDAAKMKVGILLDTLAEWQALGFLDLRRISTTALYNELNERYGLHYKLENFRKARGGKRYV